MVDYLEFPKNHRHPVLDTGSVFTGLDSGLRRNDERRVEIILESTRACIPWFRPILYMLMHNYSVKISHRKV